ncbi:hypothetical protein MNAN1_002806 [Malassezia nana]|uniref:Protein PBN1 n=1 Tax=Malassezia nana TaxID=180528 RepID=A0AAF0J362_9BASI|nr:hypothetical protein MNAN1_002806 [Malassezia nana]
MELVTTPAGGRLRWTERTSYAPTAWIDVPDAPEGCSLHLLYTLPPTVFFDPYTARCTPPVVDRHLWGPIDLEHMPGWASESRWAAQIEKAPPAWWEGEGPRAHAPCTGSACEHTALLLDLAHGGEVRIPLHVRYAHAVPMPLLDRERHGPEAFRTWIERLHSQTPHAWARRALDLVQRGLAAAQPWIATPTAPQALFADAPVVLAQCASPPPQWETIVIGTGFLRSKRSQARPYTYRPSLWLYHPKRARRSR